MARRDPPPDPVGLLATTGAVAAFGWRLLRELPGARAHVGEALRQAGLVAAGSTAVIIALATLAGGSCGLESSAVARAFGAAPIAGGFSAFCTLREVVPFVFGYVVSAKVGCGMVAELGAMRAGEEIDALEAMGVRTVRYLVLTRLIGCAIALPAAYLLAIAGSYLAAYLISIDVFGDVSSGTWQTFFFSFQDGWDLAYSMVKGAVIAVFVVVVALYHGYGLRRAGPVEVGYATARSMAVNIVGVTLISMFGTLIFWGANPRIPIG